MFAKKTYLLAILALVCLVRALPVDLSVAEAVVKSRLAHDDWKGDRSVNFLTVIRDDNTASALAYVFELNPVGYVIVGADDRLPPVIAYSYKDVCRDGRHAKNILFDIIRRDAINRLSNTGGVLNADHEKKWQEYITGNLVTMSMGPFQQWPPEGSTPTEGWLMENWDQGAPYNNYCPLDLVHGARSVAGCPAVAMAAIVNFQEEINNTRFDDGDDYHHSFYESYWIDDDHLAHDFPSWPELNVYLDTLESHYDYSVPVTTSDKAALVYACGVACHQVYSSLVSGTYGINQAATAYLRFGFSDAELLYDSSDSLFERLSQNMKDAMPAHMGIVDSTWTYGHNLVVDGYNTDEFYHFNFGWSGSYNGWFQFPLTGMPYNMNVIEGVILDIGESQTGVKAEDGTPDVLIAPALAIGSNPVRSDLGICITLQRDSHVNLSLYSITGRLVAEIADREFITGSHTLHWRADGLNSGVYIVSAKYAWGTASEKIIVLE
jgi:hypothetical protein